MFENWARASKHSKKRASHRPLTHLLLIFALALGWTNCALAKRSITRKGSSGAHGSEAGPDLHAGDLDRVAPATPDGKTTIFFLNLGMRHDLGTFTQKETVGRADIRNDVMDMYALGPLVQLGLLFPIANRLRVGGAFGYSFNYTLTERQEGKNNGDPNRTQLGQLITADLRLEWNPLLAGPVSLILAPVATLTAIAAGGDLRTATNSLEDSHNTWKGPRLGWAAGAEAGFRYMLTDWFSLKVVGGYAYTVQGLLHATRKGDAADSKRIWRAQASRVTALLGAEAHF